MIICGIGNLATANINHDIIFAAVPLSAHAYTMFLISILILNIVIILGIKVFCKLTYGINKCSRHLVGKVVIVTGGNAGIGFETAKDLADRGARVIIGCRDAGRGTTARDKIISATGNKEVFYKHLDLASLASVRSFADEIIKSEKQLDILINNAGVLETTLSKTEDGLCTGMQINHFAPFLLTNLLLPLLKQSAPSRIITVSSTAHRYGTIDFDNLNLEKETEKSFGMWKLYSNTKLCNVLMTIELARLLEGTGVTANSLHPGAVDTSIANRFMNQPWMKWMKYLKYINFMVRNAWEGAQTPIYLTVSPEVSSVSGRYFAECREQDTGAAAKDTAVARKLWEVSERLVKVQ